jgi:hypothetical protein
MAIRQRPRALTAAIYVLFVISLIWSAFALAWVTLRPVDFGYPVSYDVLAIDEHIARYGPRNRFKYGFARTSDAERLRIFGEIVDAIHAGGRGLENIRYTDPRGRSARVLRQPEIVHLRSVGRLIDRLATVSRVMFGVLVLTLGAMRALRLPPPRPTRVAGWTAVALLVGAASTFAYGPEEVFNTLHTWIFPAGEQWYFYYEESLMTTLMKAPDLFGALAVLLLVVGLIWFGLLVAASHALLRRSATPARG